MRLLRCLGYWEQSIKWLINEVFISSKRYSEEFKIETVKQMTEQGLLPLVKATYA